MVCQGAAAASVGGNGGSCGEGAASAATGGAAGEQQQAYKPRCILLTGGAGFIGSHVAIRLVKRYPDVKVREEI